MKLSLGFLGLEPHIIPEVNARLVFCVDLTASAGKSS